MFTPDDQQPTTSQGIDLNQPDAPQAPAQAQSQSGFGGRLKQALQRFSYFGSQAGMKEVGLPTDDELAMHQAQMQHIQQQTAMVKAQQEQLQQTVPFTRPDGSTIMIPLALAKTLYPAQARADAQRDVAGIKTDSAETIAGGKNQTVLDKAAADNASKEKIAAGKNAVAETLGRMKAASGSGKLGALGVTNTTRAMSEMATTVLPQMDQIKGRIDKLAASLGTAAGRWNQLMVNKGGTDFPAFAGLDTDLDLLASAIVRTHFGARGGQEYRKELRKQFGEAQSPEDLKSRIDSAKIWIQGYADAAKNPVGGPAPAPVKPSSGVVVWTRDANGKPVRK
jgi:hypothetical protein